MNELLPQADVNQASLEELIAVPGIGAALAERIIAARPYQTVDDLTRVSGIGPQMLEKIKPYLAIQPAAFEAATPVRAAELEAQPVDAGQWAQASPLEDAGREVEKAAIVAEQESGVEGVPVAQQVPEAGAEPKQAGEAEVEPEPVTEGEPESQAAQPEAAPEAAPVAAAAPAPAAAGARTASAPQAEEKPLQRSEVLWVAAGLAILVLALSLLFSLGTLGMINRTLNFASASQAQALSNRAEAMSNRIDLLEGDVDSLRSRLNAFEALSGRVTTLERNNAALRSDLESAQAELAVLEQQSLEFSRQIEELENKNNVFQNFLDGLRRLLNVGDGK